MTDLMAKDLEPARMPRPEIAIEQGVLGALLNCRKDELNIAGAILRSVGDADAFYQPKHAMIYRKAAYLVNRGEAPNPLAILGLFDEADYRATDNGLYVHELIEHGFADQGTWFGKQLRQAASGRQAAELYSAEIRRLAAAGIADMAEVIKQGQERVAALRSGGGQGNLVSLANLTNNPDVPSINQEVVDWLAEIAKSKQLGQVAGAMSGLSELDELLHGGQAGQVIVIAGRPGMAKTTVAVNWAINAARRQRKAVAVFSLEMGRVEIGLKVLSSQAKIPINRLRSGELNDDDWINATDFFTDAGEETIRFYVDDNPACTIDDIDSALATLNAELAGQRRADIAAGIHPDEACPERVELVVVDYLQLMEGARTRNGNREQEVAGMSRGIKKLAKFYKTCILLLSQLNRGPENRPNKIPLISDLRESGSVEQDADVVILLHREDYYDKESPRAGEIDYIVAKHRNGATDTITCAAQLHISKISGMGVND